MIQIVAIGLGAGATAALLFASIASGSLFAVLLFYLAPLPILLAALGWSHVAALIGAVSGAFGLALVLGDLMFFVAFLVGVGLPAWWLGYLALLARPAAAATGRGETLDWYPIGRLAFWAAILGALIVVAALPTLGWDEESIRSGLRQGLERMISAGNPDAPTSGGDTASKRVIEVLASIVPSAAAVLSTVINLVNLWLAARIVKLSGRLRRPWPDLAELRPPPQAPIALAAAIVACFLPGLAGMVGGIFVATLLMLYGIVGLAILHFASRGLATRGLLLSVTYASLLIFGWPMLVLTMFGLVDIAVDLRARLLRKRGPPRAPPA